MHDAESDKNLLNSQYNCEDNEEGGFDFSKFPSMKFISARNYRLRGMSRYDAVVDKADDETRDVLIYYLRNMPLSDLISQDPEFLLDAAGTYTKLIKKIKWLEQIPEEYLLPWVAWYRVNNESTDFKRSEALDFLIAEIGEEELFSKSLAGAILEINKIASSYVGYSPSDRRTAGPLAVLRRGFGRCGEETVLVVSLLRAAGIPARQLYTPAWAHCNDNHAWVEAYDGKAWRFFGACEAEPILDKAWFNKAATRALYIQSSGIKRENLTASYAETELRSFCLSEESKAKLLQEFNGQVPDMHLRISVLNSNNSIAIIKSYRKSINQTIKIRLGSGSIHLTASFSKKDELSHYLADETFLLQQNNIEHFIEIHNKYDKIEEFSNYAYAPLTGYQKNCNLNITQRAESRRLHSILQIHRYERRDIADAIKLKKAEEYDLSEKLNRQGNRYELFEQFIEDAEKKGFKKSFTTILFKAISDKDLADIKYEVLLDILNAAEEYKSEAYENTLKVFSKDLIAPRIYLEPLSAYRGVYTRLFEYLEEGLVAKMKKDPAIIANLVTRCIKVFADKNLETLSEKDYNARQVENIIAPVRYTGLYQTASERELPLLLVAAARSVGVPARLNPIFGYAEYADLENKHKFFNEDNKDIPYIDRFLFEVESMSTASYRNREILSKIIYRPFIVRNNNKFYNPGVDQNYDISPLKYHSDINGYIRKNNKEYETSINQISEIKDYFSDKSPGFLKLIVPGSTPVSIQKLNDHGEYNVLNFENEKLFKQEALTKGGIIMPQGIYQIIRSRRLPTGNQSWSRIRYFQNADTQMLILPEPEVRPEALMTDYKISEILAYKDRDLTMPVDLLAEERFYNAENECINRIMLFIDTSREPSRQILTELMMNAESIFKYKPGIDLIVLDRQSMIVDNIKSFSDFLNAEIFYQLPESTHRISAEVFCETGQYPLALLMNKDKNCLTANAGYRVGQISIISDCLAILEAGKY